VEIYSKPWWLAIDKGRSTEIAALDFLGVFRIFGCIKADMGAYEY
jgi:hypothetical protein